MMILQIKNQSISRFPKIPLCLQRVLHRGVGFISNSRIITVSFLFCIVFFLFSLSVFAQIISEESLEFLEEQRNPSAKETEEKSGVVEKPGIKYKAAKSRDPFKPQLFIPKEKVDKKEVEKEVKVEELIEPTGPKVSELFSLSIQGIIWNSDNPLVIINNKVLQKGEFLLVSKGEELDAKIIISDIDKDGVTINYAGREEKIPSPATLKSQKTKKTKGEKNE